MKKALFCLLPTLLIRCFITAGLFTISYLMHFTQSTASNFCCFLNRLLDFKKRLTPKSSGLKQANKTKSQDSRVNCVKFICTSVDYFPILISTICAIVPESAFNPLEITIPFIKYVAGEHSLFFKLAMLIHMIACWALWSSIIPAAQLAASARLIFIFSALKHCNCKLYE